MEEKRRASGGVLDGLEEVGWAECGAQRIRGIELRSGMMDGRGCVCVWIGDLGLEMSLSCSVFPFQESDGDGCDWRVDLLLYPYGRAGLRDIDSKRIVRLFGP